VTIIDDAPVRTVPEGLTAPTVKVLTDRCAGCQECVVRCPAQALSMDVDTWTVATASELCVGCRQCERTCPFAAIQVSGSPLVEERQQVHIVHPEQVEGDRSETRLGFTSWAEALAEAARCLSCPDPTCVRGCPAHNDIPGFVAAVADGDLDTAHRILSRTTVMPDVCSRVCDQAVQCEGACTWSLAGGTPVAIGAIERFITDNAPVPPLGQDSNVGAGLSVAVVGAGPAGIGAAATLVKAGASVTVFERDAEPGGLLGWGIPEFTLPKAVSDRPWVTLTEAGVELRCNEGVDAAGVERLRQEYDAVVLAHGAGTPIRMRVPGADLEGVEDATAFLHEGREALASGTVPDSLAPRTAADGTTRPATVLVLGAGNTAMDVARIARRLGALPVCVDWLDRKYAPVRPDELAEAEDEGVEVRFSSTLDHLEGEDGRVARAVLLTTTQESASSLPTPQPGSGQSLDVDLVVMAMGYRLDADLTAHVPAAPLKRQATGVPDRRWIGSGLLAAPAPPAARGRPIGTLALGREVALSAAILPEEERVWAAGDALVGPSTVVEAMAQGRRAAFGILERQPRRPGRGNGAGDRPVGLRVVVATESRSGTTERIGGEIAAGLVAQGATVRQVKLADLGAADLLATDLLVIGSWVEGLVVAKVGPAPAARRALAELPGLAGLPVALFCTYGINPRRTLDTMADAIVAKGGRVVGSAAFGRKPNHAPRTVAKAWAKEVSSPVAVG
jgi:glutamate synthase (NADPH/NADH) small chain